MKDMHFPIHILWIDEQFVIRGVVERAEPATFPDMFHSPVPVPYVLEVHADAIQNVRRYEGSQIQFSCMQKPVM
jgi:uncharacterized membrane protein (UPF0127 family)